MEQFPNQIITEFVDDSVIQSLQNLPSSDAESIFRKNTTINENNRLLAQLKMIDYTLITEKSIKYDSKLIKIASGDVNTKTTTRSSWVNPILDTFHYWTVSSLFFPTGFGCTLLELSFVRFFIQNCNYYKSILAQEKGTVL